MSTYSICFYKEDEGTQAAILRLQNYSVYIQVLIFCLFVCVEVLRPSQPNGVMSSAVSFPNHTFTGQAYFLFFFFLPHVLTFPGHIVYQNRQDSSLQSFLPMMDLVECPHATLQCDL